MWFPFRGFLLYMRDGIVKIEQNGSLVFQVFTLPRMYTLPAFNIYCGAIDWPRLHLTGPVTALISKIEISSRNLIVSPLTIIKIISDVAEDKFYESQTTIKLRFHLASSCFASRTVSKSALFLAF